MSLGAAPPSSLSCTLVIHGGAGVVKQHVTEDIATAAHAALRRALDAGEEILANNGTAIDAVEAAVRVMEDDPVFNAGCGAVLNSKGDVEMEAMVMDGATHTSGAVVGCRRVRNPVLLARQTMARTPHRMLAGPACDEYASEWGLKIEDPSYFITPQRQAQLRAAQGAVVLDHHLSSTSSTGTVGAVAVDAKGNVAAATSTGGLTGKWPGRVGDTPVIGSGTWADNATCAISATGTGEAIMSIALAHRIAHTVELKGSESFHSAVDDGITKLTAVPGGIGGVIAVSPTGEYAMPFNSEGMFRGVLVVFRHGEVCRKETLIF